MRRRQRDPSPPTDLPEDLPPPPPPSPGTASVWVGGSTNSQPGQHVSRIHSNSSNTPREGQDSARQCSGSSGDGEYVVVSVRNSTSDSEPGSSNSSRRSSERRAASHSSDTCVPGSGHSRSSSNSSSIVDAFPPPPPPLPPACGTDPVSYGQQDRDAGQSLAAASVGALGHRLSDASDGPDGQNVAFLAGSIGSAGLFVPSPVFAGSYGSNQNAVLSGNVGQNAAFFPNTGTLPNVAPGGNPANVFAANPGVLFNGGPYVPATSSGMTVLPPGSYDPSALLLQQQLLASTLGQTLPQGQPMPQNLDLLQSQGQVAASSFSQAQPTPQSLSLLQAQAAAFSQGQPLPPNLNLLQTQALLQNLTLTQAGGTGQNLNFPQVQNPDLYQAQVTAQNNVSLLQPQTSLPQAAAFLQQPMPVPQSLSRPESPDSTESERADPVMGHSFEMLAAIVAANQARLPTPAQSPTAPEPCPADTSPQLTVADDTPELPPAFTGLSDNGEDQATSGLGSSVSSSISDSNPTSPNTDVYPLTPEDRGNVQYVQVEPCYDRPWDKGACLRCGKKVYTMEKVGPVKEVLYHKTCFTCVACHTQLNLKNFHHNEADLADLNVYCLSHKPTARAKPLDSSAVGIKRALTVPKTARVNEQIRGGPAGKSIHLDSLTMRRALHAPAPDLQASIKQREGAWFREERKYERMPPEDVIRHDEQQYEGSRSLYSSYR